MTETELAIYIEETKGIVLAAVRKYLPPSMHHSIDDAVQETYLRVYRSFAGMEFTDETAMKNWLYTIAKNESLRLKALSLKDNARINKLIESGTETGSIMDCLSDDINFLRDVIALLPEKYRLVFELLILGFSEKEVAEKLSIRHGTVKSRIHRGRELIYRRFYRKGVKYHD